MDASTYKIEVKTDKDLTGFGFADWVKVTLKPINPASQASLNPTLSYTVYPLAADPLVSAAISNQTVAVSAGTHDLTITSVLPLENSEFSLQIGMCTRPRRARRRPP